jgi:DNA-binding NtrC family response regulator
MLLPDISVTIYRLSLDNSFANNFFKFMVIKIAMNSYLIITPQKEACSLIQNSIPAESHIFFSDDIEKAFQIHLKHKCDVIFVDLCVLRPGGFQNNFARILSTFRESNPFAGIVMLSSKEDIREVVKMVKAGASDYLSYPIDSSEVRLVIETLQESLNQNLELDYLRDCFWKTEWLERIHTRTDRMRDVYKKIRAVAPTKATVMLSGETGTGKSMFARLIHLHSSRSDNPFIVVHCGAIPDTLLESELFGHEKGAFTGAVRMKRGKFELAQNGTIFLDEVGTISPAAQVKLLQVLQDATFNRVGGEKVLKTDARIIAATNSDLAGMSENGDFRKDLFYRLNVFPIELPSLKERKEDIPLLIDQFLKKLNARHGKGLHSVHPKVITALRNYQWPGNIRELENLMERAYILETSQVMAPENFPAELFNTEMSSAQLHIDTHMPLAEARQKAVGDFERQYLNELFARTKGRVNLTAREAGIGTRQLNKLMAKYGIRKESFKN